MTNTLPRTLNDKSKPKTTTKPDTTYTYLVSCGYFSFFHSEINDKSGRNPPKGYVNE